MPMISKKIEDMIESAESKYRLTMVASKRSRQINNGSQPLLTTRSVKPTTISLEELSNGLLEVQTVDNVNLVKKTQTAPAGPGN
jgi:DNA-directed RNA polymerase subunit omega